MGISLCVAAGRLSDERKKSFISSSPLFTRVALWGWKSQLLLLLFLAHFVLPVSLSLLLLLTLNPAVVHVHKQVTERSPTGLLEVLVSQIKQMLHLLLLHVHYAAFKTRMSESPSVPSIKLPNK